MDRLTKVEDGARTTYAYDAANQIETEEDASGTTTYTFDDNGNLQVENAGGDRTTYTWDIENMCVGIVLPDDSLNIFAYDGDLVRREAEDSDGLVKFVNDEQNVLLETDSGGTTQVAYTLEPAGYGNLVSQRRSGATSWHLFDGLGSTDRLLDSSETEEASYINTAFGVPKAVTGNHANRLRFVGRLGYRWEPDTSQYDIRRRRLDPARGRWLSADPGDRETQDYWYVDNMPPQLADASGLQLLSAPCPKREGNWRRCQSPPLLEEPFFSPFGSCYACNCSQVFQATMGMGSPQQIWNKRADITFMQWHTAVRRAWVEFTDLTEAANKERIGLLSAVMLCIIVRESGGDPHTRGPGEKDDCQTVEQFRKNDLGLFQNTHFIVDDARDFGLPARGVSCDDLMRCDPSNNIRMAIGAAAWKCTHSADKKVGKAVKWYWAPTSISSAECRGWLATVYWKELGLPKPRPGFSDNAWEDIHCTP